MAVGEDAGSASAETPGRHAVSVLLAFGKCLGALLPVYLAGYFGLSLCFVVLGLVVYLGWRQHRDGKQARLNTAMYVLENERDFTTTRLFRSRRDLPAWVNFPDVEKVEWLNKILQQAWPFVGQYLEKLLVETIAPTIRTSSAHLQTFSFTKVDLGDKAVKVVGVKAHTEHDKRQVLLDLYISYAGNVEINVEIKKYFCKAGVKGIQLHGKLRVILEPLIGDVPLVGAVTMFFIRRPKLDINWTGLTNLLDIPCLNAMSDTMVMDAIASFLVLPNRLTVPLVADLHVAQLRSPLPRGIVRIHLVEAENLAAKDTFIKGVIAGKSDPYAVLRVGTQTFTSHHVDNNLNPQWREMYEVIVHEVPGQELEVEVFDKDPDQDDFLGRYYCSVHFKIITWFTLKDAPSGKVHLRLEWLSLLPSAERLNEVRQNLTVSSKTPDPPSAAILTVYLDQAQDLPMKKGNKDPSPMVQLSVQDTTKESRTVYGTNNPVWEDAFTFFIQDPRKQDLDIQVKDDDRSLTLGTLSIPLSRLLSSTELSMDQWFQLDNSGPASRIYMNAVLRGVLRIHLVEAQDLVAKDSFMGGMVKGKSDPYVKIRVGGLTFKSRVIKENLNPVWNELYEVCQEVQFDLYDKDMDQDDFLVILLISLCGIQILQYQSQHSYVNKAVPSAAVLFIYMEQAHGLPVSSILLHSDDGFLFLLQSVAQVLMHLKLYLIILFLQLANRSASPRWDEAFCFLIHDPREDIVSVKLSHGWGQPLGAVVLPVREILAEQDLVLDRWLTLDGALPESQILIRAELKVTGQPWPAVLSLCKSSRSKLDLFWVHVMYKTATQFTDTFVRACCACFCVCRGGVAGDSGRGQVKVTIAYSFVFLPLFCCRNLPPCSKDGSDPYVSFLLQPDKNRSTKRKTSIKKRDLNPEFNERFDFDLSLEEATQRRLDLSVKNSVSFMSRERELIGKLHLDLNQLDLKAGIPQW
uniref:Extended synaptotagmin-like protein 1a n=1 Tax=Pygocentrus nattereri TaxID=42514 RepID=A0AAR2JI63_PYGNA